MPDWKPPPVPASRLDRGDEWRELWGEAHRVMQPYGVRPSRHFIDRIVGKRRGWMRAQLATVALATLAEPDLIQIDAREQFHCVVLDDATMERVRVRVIVDPEPREIISIFEVARWRGRTQ